MHPLPRRCGHPGLRDHQSVRRVRAAPAGQRPLLPGPEARHPGLRPGLESPGQSDRGGRHLQLHHREHEGLYELPSEPQNAPWVVKRACAIVIPEVFRNITSHKMFLTITKTVGELFRDE